LTDPRNTTIPSGKLYKLIPAQESPKKVQIIITSQSKAPKMTQGKLHDMNQANNHVIGKLGFKMSTLIIQDQLMI
jgi:hypothetical protein